MKHRMVNEWERLTVLYYLAVLHTSVLQTSSITPKSIIDNGSVIPTSFRRASVRVMIFGTPHNFLNVSFYIN